ncbi:MAG: alpha/beta hydrolase [Polyangiaceae bacterium]|nr:alpha/beta hydrolase [Polyangiaceae bacterium]MCW5792052.1 alpha/beta hydrolase [Polyangiaceae bacterium]
MSRRLLRSHHLTSQGLLLTLGLALGTALIGACGESDGGSPSGTPDASTQVDAGDDPDSGADAEPSDSGLPDADIPPDLPLELEFTTPPVDNLPDGARFARDVAYGAHSQQVMDVFLPASDAPTGALIYFHGGGFVNGSRVDAYSGSGNAVRRTLESGAAWIGVDYRLLSPAGVEDEGVIKSLRDCARALQFVRRHAEELNIDAPRVGVYGSSAGAGASLWLAYHPDMARPGGADRVGQESTRPIRAVALSTQATYDLMRWAPDIFQGSFPYVTNDLLLTQPALRRQIVQFYGLDGALIDDAAALKAKLESAEVTAYAAGLDMLDLMSSDDPATYVDNPASNAAPTEPGFDLLHHPQHARALHDAAGSSGADVQVHAPAIDLGTGRDPISFLLEAM